MKKILVLSDIHIPTRLKFFPYEKIKSLALDIDMVFGLGDYVNQKTLDNLYSFGKEVYAVAGNMDEHIIKANLPEKLIINVEQVEIGLIHGWGGHWKMRNKISNQFENVDLICYGHTHSSFFGKELNKLFFNPGSLCHVNPSFGILKINNKKIEAEIINL